MRTYLYTSSKILASILVVAGLCLQYGALQKASAQAVPGSDAVSAREAQLRAELDQVLAEIDAQQKELDAKKGEGQSIARDISILDGQINLAQKKIQAHNIAIQTLGKDIGTKTETIKELSDKIDQNKESLAQLMRKTNEIDDFSLPEVILTNQNISDFFADLDTFNSIKEKMGITYHETVDIKAETETEKQALDKKRAEEINSRISVQAEQSKIKVAEADKKKLLAINKQAQGSYQAVISAKTAQAAAIRSALFALRDTSAIPFGKALDYANYAQQKTGVRPAFVLAILTQESNLGANTGSCYVTDFTTGAGAGANTGRAFANVMHPTRDIPVFQTLMAALGRDPKSTKVSCPQSIGYGGAMGPAQFIPSTWKIMMPKLTALTGIATPDPWDPKTAITASAQYLADLGAGGGTYAAEQDAACKYFSGRACSAGVGATYGAQVMAKATTIQTTMIDPLAGN